MTDFQRYLDRALTAVEVPAESVGPSLSESAGYDIFTEISEQIISARNNNGMTQKELAEKTGLTQAQISRIENRSGHPNVETLKRIADGLGLRLVVSFESFEEDA